MAYVFIDGVLKGTVKSPESFVSKLIDQRRSGKVSKNLNIQYRENENIVQIQLDKNRLRRPLIIVKNGKSLLTENHLKQLKENKITWSDLIKNGLVEELDALEEESAIITMYEKDLKNKHTHLEIDPLIIFGMNTSMIPFAGFNQSTRLLRGQKNHKQGAGLYTLNYLNRLDTNVNILHYTQKPLVKTFTHDLYGDSVAGGQNVVIAILNHEGFNMSDGVVVNRASIDRGLARVSHYRPYSAERLRYSGGQLDEIKVPDKEVQGYSIEADYKHLDTDGLISPETHVTGGEVLVGKTSQPRFLSRQLETFSTAANITKDTSIKVKYAERGTVSKVLLTESKDGNPLVNIEVRDTRPIGIGDKVSSRHGQKGVIGYIEEPQNMPFSSSGTVPDILFSPFGMRRMTVSQLIESIGGKVGALNGRLIDGTPFSGEDSRDLRKELEDLGFLENGTETLYDGRTGKAYEAKIFVGNIFYLRLKHQVADKIQSRARGRVQLLTRQPTAGKAMEGGLRFGDMEKDTLIAHGSSLLLKERFSSDREIVSIGDRSGDIAEYDGYTDKFVSVVDPKETISKVEMAYGFKLLLEQLKSLGINPKLNLKDKFNQRKKQ